MASGSRPRKRRPTFDSITEFEDYTNLLDEETKELLQKDDHSKKRQISNNQNSQDTEENGKLTNGTNDYFNQWHQSRRRTMDELESRGVLNPNYFNLASKNNNNAMTETRTTSKAHELGDFCSIISADDVHDSDDYEEMEFNKNDLFYIHCHQIIKKEIGGANSNIFNDLSISAHAQTVAPSAPPPTAVQTPITTSNVVKSNGFGTMQHVVKSKLERHSKQMEQKEMANLLEEEDNANKRPSHFIAQKSIQSILSSACDTEQESSAVATETQRRSNAFNILYESIPSNLDSGLLSCNIFLAYKQWIESRIIRYTEEAGECLDQMKKESNQLEALHRDTVHKSSVNMLYDGDDNIDKTIDNRLNNAHLRKLSQIDENLADIRDKLARMVRVQKHCSFIWQQYDTHMDGFRSDQSELLSILCELRERRSECESILCALGASEVWLITNMANIMAERSENIDTLNRRISQCDDEDPPPRLVESVANTKLFIEEVNHLIGELRVISDRKRQEIERLSRSIASLSQQNCKLIATSHQSYDTVLHRLFELQTHYKLPLIMESNKSSSVDAITASLNIYLTKINCNNYYNRSLDAYRSACILSKPHSLKPFYSKYMLLMQSIFVDSLLMNEYIETNYITKQNEFESIFDDDDDDDDALPTQHNKQSTTALLNDVFTPIALEPSQHSFTQQTKELLVKAPPDRHKLLNDLSSNDSFQESIQFIQNIDSADDCTLLNKIQIIALFVQNLSHRETLVAIVAQQITCDEHVKQQIMKRTNENKIREFAVQYVVQLLQYLFKNKTKFIKSVKKINKNVYKCAARILNNVYNIDMPFPITAN